MLKFLFTNESEVSQSKAFFAQTVAKFEKVLKIKIAEILKGNTGEISLTLVNDSAIQKLNRKYRGKNMPTDVLSFAYMEDAGVAQIREISLQIGDIFISVDTAKTQAKEHGHSLKKELEILFVHGLLHLFGFDHGDDKEEREMEKWAGKVLEHIL
ncbi:MAG: rRNA maturation RNase YbeY [Candidatus Gracilibacteria bacterium]|nr:rRNA maturation RNase YbeY [Candidatus Gracilibacteria bacterium]